MAAAVSLARYLMDEASSGTGPTTLVDDTGNSNDLGIVYGSSMAWDSIAAGNGLTYTGNAGVCNLADIITNGTVGSTLNGATEASAVTVSDGNGVFTSGGHLITLAEGNFAPQFNIQVNNTGVVQVYCMGTIWSFPAISGLTVIHAVIDTTEGTTNDRVSCFFDGVEQVGTGTVIINSTFALTTAHNITVGNRSTGFRSLSGSLYYAELFSGILTQEEIDDQVTNLLANNDADASSGGGGGGEGDTYLSKLQSLGFSGTPGVMQVAYLADQGFTGDYNQALYQHLAALGYTDEGVMNRLKQKQDAEGYASLGEMMTKTGILPL